MSKSKKLEKESTVNITHVLLGIGLLALTIYTGWIIFQAPSGAGMDIGAYGALLQEKMGFLGGLIYLLMHGLMGRGIVLFPFLLCLCGLCLLSGKHFTQMQVTGGVLAGLTVLAVLHMNITYIDAKDDLLLGLSGNGGGVIGAALSLVLQKALGTVGAYIVLFCVAMIAVVLIAQGAVLGKGGDFFATVQQRLEQIKEALLHFIFIEETDDDYEEDVRTPVEKTEPVKKSKNKGTVQRVEPNPASDKKASVQQKQPKQKEKKWGRLKSFFVEEEQQEPTNLRARYTGTEYVVIPKEKPVILSSLVEIHKALDEQEPRVGLSPREPLVEEPYYIQDSVEDFQQLLEKRQVKQSEKATEPKEAVKQKPQKPAAKEATSAAPAEIVTAEASTEAVPENAAEPVPEQPEDGVYHFPSIDLLEENKNAASGKNMNEIMQNVERLEKTLSDFGVKGKIADVSCGPAITRYEFQPAAGIKVSKIVNLADDIALSMAVAGVRIEAPIPGKAAVGIEIPNKSTTTVCLRELIESDAFQNSKSKLTVALGKDISGQAVVADLSKMPHLLIAGSTGSGKSVCINTLINSVLYKATPDEVKFVMVDPKKVELGNYNGIPHLISPVVTDPKKAASALRWAVQEMDRRYEVFAANGVKDMPRFNKLSEERIAAAQTEEEKAAIEVMPYIVVLIDELADLMMVAPADVEDAICRLAQLARAAGIHLVVATQRPSVDVITGIIKANMPSRIAFAVSSQTDSRTILDMGGAEKLLGRGDMLFYPTGMPKPQRVQGVYVSDKEIDRIVEAVKIQGQPVYNEEIGTAAVSAESNDETEEDWDDLIPEATKLFIENGQASISLLQRRFRVGYTRAARIVDQMEQRGLVGPYEGSKPRQIKVTMTQYLDMVENGEL